MLKSGRRVFNIGLGHSERVVGVFPILEGCGRCVPNLC